VKVVVQLQNALSANMDITKIILNVIVARLNVRHAQIIHIV
jgi:hypothetical protein